MMNHSEGEEGGLVSREKMFPPENYAHHSESIVTGKSKLSFSGSAGPPFCIVTPLHHARNANFEPAKKSI
jgi:hypothetical protein